MGASPTRLSLQPEATGAIMEATKWLKPSDRGGRSQTLPRGGEQKRQSLLLVTSGHSASSAEGISALRNSGRNQRSTSSARASLRDSKSAATPLCSIT